MIHLCARAHNPEDVGPMLAEGFDTLEITLPCSGGMDEEKVWLKLAVERGLKFIAHGPSEGDPRNLDHLTQNIVPIIRQTLEAAERLSVTLLTLHFNTDSRWIPPETIKGKIALLAKIAGWGSDLGVRVNVENLSEDWADLEKTLTANPKLGLTLDVGHAMLTRPASTSPDIINHLHARITHLHLHDNHGGMSPKQDLHLIPGQGAVDFVGLFSMLKARNYNGTATLELAPHEMHQGREKILEFWNAAN